MVSLLSTDLQVTFKTLESRESAHAIAKKQKMQQQKNQLISQFRIGLFVPRFLRRKHRKPCPI